MEETREVLAAKFQAIFPHLDERQRRLLMGAEARALGHGGIRAVATVALTLNWWPMLPSGRCHEAGRRRASALATSRR